jgi:acetyl esterase/lipase
MCGEADPDCLSLNVITTRDIDVSAPVPCGRDYQCVLKVDSFALPRAAGTASDTGRPVVVMIPGGPLPPGNRTDLWNLARIVAGRGAVVFTADYRSSRTFGGGFPATFADVACAIRSARERAPKLGGDPSRVTLVAHSYGGFPGTVLAMSATDYATDDTACLATTGDGRPDAFVSIAGVFALDRIGQEFLADFFGGDRANAPAAWGAGDVTVLARRANRRLLPVRLVSGTMDLVAPPASAEQLATTLRAAGYSVDVTVEDGATHDLVLYRLATVDAIVAAYTAAR